MTTAVVTGAASGIGLALCELLQQQGVTIARLDRDRAKLPSSELSFAVDVRDRDRVQDSVQKIVEKTGSIDLWFSCAGVGIAGEVRDMQPQDWKRVFDINVYGVLNCIDAVYPLMIEQGSGHLVNIASVAGLIPLPCEAPYVASKHAVVGLSSTLRAEAQGFGVRVSVVCPGVVDTPIYDTSEVKGFDKQKALSLFPKGISAQRCASQILKGVEKNRANIVITPLAQVLWRLHRLSPRLYMFGAQHYLRRMRSARLSEAS